MEKLVNCKKCKKEISPGVLKCPFCDETNPTVTTRTQIIAIVFIIVLAAVLVKACELTPEEKAAAEQASIDRECKNPIAAQVMSQNFIKQHLKSPASADFPIQTNRAIYKGNCLHLIESYVDSQNGFGALIRSQTFVQLRYNKTTKQWQLEDIKIN